MANRRFARHFVSRLIYTLPSGRIRRATCEIRVVLLQIDYRKNGYVKYHLRRVDAGSSECDRHSRASNASRVGTHANRHRFQRRGISVCLDNHRVCHLDPRHSWHHLHLRVLVQVSRSFPLVTTCMIAVSNGISFVSPNLPLMR